MFFRGFKQIHKIFHVGILRDKTMNDKITQYLNGEKQNYPFCKLKLCFERSRKVLHSLEPTKQSSLKDAKVFEQIR